MGSESKLLSLWLPFDTNCIAETHELEMEFESQRHIYYLLPVSTEANHPAYRQDIAPNQ